MDLLEKRLQASQDPMPAPPAPENTIDAFLVYVSLELKALDPEFVTEGEEKFFAILQNLKKKQYNKNFIN